MKSHDSYNENTESFAHANPITVLKLIRDATRVFFKEKPGIIMFSGILLLMLWGYHGDLDLLQKIIPEWSFPDIAKDRHHFIPGIAWDKEIISFFGGVFLVVLVPVLIIKFWFKDPLSEYGLAFPPKEKRRLSWMVFFTLLIILAPTMYLASKDGEMNKLYPFFKYFESPKHFILYELSYFPFFLAIEFIFRGYFLFGLANNGFRYKNKTGDDNVFYIGRYAILVGMLSYTAWHLGKPLTELWATPIWGLAAGACTYAVRSIWPALMVHWLINVFLDYMIIYHPF